MMRSAVLRSSLLVALAGATVLEANQITLPGSIGVSVAGRDSDPAAAFNTVDRTWLMVWREASASIPNAGSIVGRIIREDRTILTAPFTIGIDGQAMTAPRVAHDPLRNEWMVVWATAPCVFDTCRFHTFARKVGPGGALIGTEPRALSPGDEGEAFPDVAAARLENTIIIEPPTPYFLATWQQNVAGQPAILALRLLDSAAEPSRIGINGSPFRVDAGGDLPPDRRSTRPRISTGGPLGRTSGPVGAGRIETHPRIVYEVESGGQRDVWLSQVNMTTVFHSMKVAGSGEDEDLPQVDYHPVTGRTLVLYRRGGDIQGQLIEPTSIAPFHALLGDPFRVTAGSASTLAPQAGTDIFFASAFNGGAFGLGCIAGRRVAGTPAAGALNGDHLSLSASSAGNVLLAFRRADPGTGATFLRASILVIPPVPLPSTPPVARAGADLQVTEGTLFSLNGATSSDPDDDPLRFEWSRSDGGDPADFFTDPGQRTRADPRLLAPLLGPDATPLALAFELRADDFRSQPAFPSADTVRVTVVPGADPDPPVAEAGPPRTVGEGAGVQLDGSASSDPGGDPLSFSWTLTAVQPPRVAPGSVAISGAGTARPSFTAPRFASPGGLDLTFRLTVSTPRGGTGQDTVVVHVQDSINEPPVAEASGPATVDEGTTFVLNGLASHDPNGDAISFHWRLASTLSFNGPHQETVDIQGGDTGFPGIVAQVFNERDLEFILTVRDPAGLQSSDIVKLRVKTVPMRIVAVEPMEGSPGTPVTITGVNLYEPGTRVYFGAESLDKLGVIESISDTKIVVMVPGGGPSALRSLSVAPNLRSMIAHDSLSVVSGPVIVRKQNETFRTAQDFTVSHLLIGNVFLSQGVPIYPLAKGKDTLVFATVRPAPGPASPLARINSGRLTVIPSEGESFEVMAQGHPATALAATAELTRFSEGVSFFIDGALLQADSYRFSLRLHQNGVEIAAAVSEVDSAVFKATRSPRILAVRMVPFQDGSVSPAYTPRMRQVFEDRIDGALEAVRRIYPAPRAELVRWPDEVNLSQLLHDDGKVYLEKFDFGSATFLFDQMAEVNSLADHLDSWNNLHPDERAQFVVAFIEESLKGGGGGGFGVPPVEVMSDIVKFWAEKNVPILGPILTTVLGVVGDVFCTLSFGLFCKDPLDIFLQLVMDILDVFSQDFTGRISLVIADDTTGTSVAHEMSHNLGFVHPSAPEHDADNISHSRYDESLAFLTFLNVPGVSMPVFNVTPPGDLFHRSKLPKALMAYSGRSDSNSFLEPEQYFRIFSYLRADFTLPLGPREEGAGGAEGPALRITGGYGFRDGSMRIREARPALPGEPLTPANDRSPLRLVFLDATGAVLASTGLPFQLSLPISVHPREGDDGDPENVFGFFRATRPIPEGTARAELRFQDVPAWSISASGSPPSVTLISPVGEETVAVEAELRVRWSSSDADGDTLRHNVYVSLDGGATFQTLAFGLPGNEHRWSTRASAGSEQAVVKVTASDGFQDGEAVSGPFRLGGGRPRACILSPLAGDLLVSSRPLALMGSVRGADGREVTDGSVHLWSSSLAGALGSGRRLQVGPLPAGVHRLRLEAALGGDIALAELEVSVLPDRDGDGVDDASEAAHGLDPDDPEDVARDGDGDGLSTAAEALDVRTDPSSADSDGDGIPDGREVLEMGSSPLRRDTDGDGLPDASDNCPLDLNADQADEDEDGMGDACDPEPRPAGPLFRRGDSNGDGLLDITDGVSLLSHLFTGGDAPACLDAADGNDDGQLDISDALTILGFLFLGGAEPPAPGPAACGIDPTADALQRCEDPQGKCR